MSEGFGPGQNGPLLLTISLPETTSAEVASELAVGEKLLTAVKATRGIESVTPPLPEPGPGRGGGARHPVHGSERAGDPGARPHAAQRGDPHGDARAPRSRVRSTSVGSTAELIDLTDRINQRLLWCIGAVVLGAFILLMMVFRSILVPLKAAVMNLLSIGAAYGVIVAVFQWGWGKELIGLRETIPIVAFVPLMMFAILFGLSMDYEVFLLSRIREEYRRTRATTAKPSRSGWRRRRASSRPPR